MGTTDGRTGGGRAPVSLKSLALIQWRQFVRNKNKGGMLGSIVGIVYFWVLEVVFFFMLKDELPAIPPAVVAGVCGGLLVLDFIFKLIFERDQSVMDAFLKSRPVPQGRWDLFLALSQFWSPANLVMPVSVLPACLLFLSFPFGLAVAAGLYLFSALGGMLVVVLKHRGRYQTEKEVSTRGKTYRSGAANAVFNLQVKSLLRSKRLKTSSLFLSIFFYLEFIMQRVAESDYLGHFYLFGFIFCAVMPASNGFAVEAGFFNGIMSRPLAVRRILEDKFRLSFFMAVAASLLCVPPCIWLGVPFYLPFCQAMFVAGFGSPLILIDAYKCVPFDLFGKTFYNRQGVNFKVSSFVAAVLLIGGGPQLSRFLPTWAACLIYVGLGLLGVAFHRPYFAWVERKFLNNKYKYLDKYMSA